jgi:hypothetical protein
VSAIAALVTLGRDRAVSPVSPRSAAAEDEAGDGRCASLGHRHSLRRLSSRCAAGD